MQNEEQKPFEIFSREELKEVRGGDGTYYGTGGPGTCFERYNDGNGYIYDVQTQKNCFETHNCEGVPGYQTGHQVIPGSHFVSWVCKHSY